jgi:hypothetical protein
VEVLTQRLDKRRSRGFAEEGMTCAQLVEAFAPSIDAEFIVVAVNGVEIPREWWPSVTPKAHATVIVAIVPGKGGGGKKNALALIASIAIAVVAPYVAGALLAGTAYAGGATIAFGVTYTAALSGAIGMAANLALGALFKPSTPSISAASASTSSASASPTYSLQGQSNVLDPFGPVRRVFGTHRVWPVVVGRPIVEVYGDDQYMTTLYDIGAGDYEVSDVRIGASHISYFQNASYYVHRNTRTPGLAWYWGARHDDQYNLQLSDGAWHQVDTVTDAGYFVVTFVFPQGVAAIDQASGGALQNIVKFYLQYADYEQENWRPVEGSYQWWSSRPINQASGTNAEVTGGQQLRSDYSASPNPDDPEGSWGGPPPDRTDGGDLRVPRVGERVIRPRTYTSTDGYPVGTTAITLRATTFAMGAGAHFAYNGTTYTIQGNVGTTPVMVGISPPLQTEIVTQVYLNVTGEDGYTTETYASPPLVTLYDVGGTYEIRDSRIQQLALSVTVRPTAEMVTGRRYTIRALQAAGFGDDRTVYGDMILAGVTTILATVPAINLRTEHTLLELRVKANDQVSGVLEELSCFAQSYLMVYRAGAWRYEISNNPAWCLLEVLRGKQNKRPITDAKIDWQSFIDWADYCDSIHPATGNMRAKFDHVVDYNTTIFALAQTITAAGRATLTPGDGRLRVIIDQPRTTPVQVFTPHNSRGFQGTRTFIEAPHAFRAKFMNRHTWKVEEFVVYNDGYNFGNASVFEQIEFPGVTRDYQVWCDARYRMAQGIHRQESWTLDVDLENLICTRGDLVHVAHDVPMLGGLPSRLKDVHYNGDGYADQWTLTEPVDFGGTPNAFGFTIRAQDGLIHQGQYGAQVDAYTVVPQAPVPTGNVRVGDLHVWGEMSRVTYPFLVAAINPQPDLAASLTLVPYAGAAIFGADTGAIPPYDPVVDHDLSIIAPPPIARVTILQKIVYANRRPLLTVSFDWRDYVAPTHVNYEVWLAWDLHEGGTPVLLGRSNAPHLEWLQDIDLSVLRSYPGTHFCVWVLGVNAFGAKRTLAETPATCDNLIGDFTKPNAPPIFDLDLKRDSITLNWEHPGDPDIDFYEVRYDPRVDGATYGASTLLAPQIAYPTRSMDVPSRLGTYYIKTIDTSGNRSDEFASSFTPGENIWQLNVIATWDDKPEGWPGSKSNFKLAGGALETEQLTPGTYAQRAEYYYADLYDGGAIFQTRFTSKIAGGAVAANSVMATWLPLASATPIGGSVVLDTGAVSAIAELVDVWHEIRWVTAEGTMSEWTPLASAIPIGLGESNFGAWRRFQVGDYIGQQFQFRLVAEYIGPDAVPDVGALIGEAWIEIDMTDRVDGQYDVACPAGGMRVLYQPAFKERPALGITGDTVSVGDRHVISNADRNGFDIEFLNGAGSVARQFDWLAKGYGMESTRVIDALTVKGARQPARRVITRRAA